MNFLNSDGTCRDLHYILKVVPDNPMYAQMLQFHNVFDVENTNYVEVVPELEHILKEAGVEVKFGPSHYKLEVKEPLVLLEDLKQKGYRNAKRSDCLDMEHAKHALKKMAQWHAASAVRIATKGKYSDIVAMGNMKKEMLDMMSQMFKALYMVMNECFKTFKGHEEWLKDVIKIEEVLSDELYALVKSIDDSEFNVLNHGDFWTNNIMFKYNDEGKIVDTLLVDFQLSKYGSPAIDLLYFIISSTTYDIKVKEFDTMIKYYHDNLVDNLKLLKYSKPLPSLKAIHMGLLKCGVYGFLTATSTMSTVLLDDTTDAGVENLMSDADKGMALKQRMFSNDKYKKHIELVMPWLQNRGALEC